MVSKVYFLDERCHSLRSETVGCQVSGSATLTGTTQCFLWLLAQNHIHHTITRCTGAANHESIVVLSRDHDPDPGRKSVSQQSAIPSGRRRRTTKRRAGHGPGPGGGFAPCSRWQQRFSRAMLRSPTRPRPPCSGAPPAAGRRCPSRTSRTGNPVRPRACSRPVA